uniref:Reverse transcriptase domain-containing protein n=1 Tax=Fundulus heteroclitus TaxID=8078 RepID=A0A3Q2R1T2_FUNHE
MGRLCEADSFNPAGMRERASPRPNGGVGESRTSPSWRELMKKRQLPRGVKVGLRVPWNAEDCQLCGLHLAVAGEASSHMKKVHKATAVTFFCKVCAGYRHTFRSAAAHASRCGGKVNKIRNGRDVKCDMCVARYATQRGLSSHKRQKHLTAGLNGPSRGPRILSASPGSTVSLSPVSPSSALSPAVECGSSLRAVFDRSLTTRESEKVPDPLTTSIKELNGWLKSQMRRMRSGKRVTKRRGNAFGYRRTSDLHSKNPKKAAYRIMQKLYERDKGEVAAMILDDLVNQQCPIELKTIEDTYRTVWEGTDGYQGLGRFTQFPKADNNFLIWPLTPEEVCGTLKSMRKRSAAGPDRIKLADLIRWDGMGLKLSAAYNCMLYNGKLPACLKNSRTILLPKTSDHRSLTEIGNWRPITVGSVILRVLSSILAARMSEACPLHQSQRGFVKRHGCAENVFTLKGLLALSRKQNRAISVAVIDLARAFDSVSHIHILDVLRHRGVDELMIQFIMNSYQRAITKIETAKGSSEEIKIKLGVKQGDPMSPILFNLAIDPLLHFLERKGRGFEAAGHSFTSLAYADDLILVSDSRRGILRNLNILQEFLSVTGLRVKITKCGGFVLDRVARARVLNACGPLRLCGQDIPWIGAGDKFDYLGVQVNPTKDIIAPNVFQTVKDMVDRISSATLKPSQKVCLLKRYAMPRVTYSAVLGMAKMNTLSEADRLVRMAVKDWLHLDPSTVDGLIYCGGKDGGLGIMRLEKQIPLLQLKEILGLLKSEDSAVSSVVRESTPHELLNRLWRKVLGENVSRSATTFDPDGIEGKTLNSTIWRKSEFTNWANKKSQGQGILLFRNDNISNHWLITTHCLHESEFILALKLRTNNVNTLTTQSRGRGGAVLCRLCKKEPESLCHILSRCPKLKRARMLNHNKICALVADEAKRKNWQVHQEKHFKSEATGTGVPDLVLVRNGKALVLDVAICFERSTRSLASVAEYKIRKYTPFVPLIMKDLQLDSAEVHGFPVGARGKWPKECSVVLEEMGLSKTERKSVAKKLAKRALLLSTDTIKLYRKLLKKRK